MLVHIVMWKLKRDEGDDVAHAHALKIKKDLEALRDVVPSIGKLVVGLNVIPSEQAADVALYSEFEHMDALNAYMTHPAHQEVVAFVRRVVSERRVVDYEV